MDRERPKRNREIMDNFKTQTAGIDLSQIPPINQKRMLTFINNFIITNVSFLNHFAATCEHKLIMNHQKILKIEAELRIIEAKVNSIPRLEEVQPDKSISSPALSLQDNVPESKVPVNIPNVKQMAELPTPELPTPELPTPELATPEVQRDPRLDKFYKMVQFGVPPPAVKQKMVQEGFDPNLLDS